MNQRFNRSNLLLFFALATACSTACAQGWADWAKNGEQLFAEGNFAAAAENFEKAGRRKVDRPEWLFRAGECYSLVRDYRKAADCYLPLLDYPQRFELAGLRYARALKQDGRSAEAIAAFQQFLRNYRGEHRALMRGVVLNDIAGCLLAIEWNKNGASKSAAVLPFNSLGQQAAPLPFSEAVLYFVAGDKLYRSNRQNEAWQIPVEVKGLQGLETAHFGSAVFAPDGSRMYCTRCDSAPASTPERQGWRKRCTLYVLHRDDSNAWSAPVRLPDYINLPNTTVLHPSVAHENGREYLFFASDRPGGLGGLDLYQCERSLASDGLDFTLPRNLGAPVNTGGDEITPFWAPAAQTLYFSSNGGHPSIGGLDAFKSRRGKSGWSKPENLGLPYNSPADDLFFVLKKNETGSFWVSNRDLGEAQNNTRDDRIFECPGF